MSLGSVESDTPLPDTISRSLIEFQRRFRDKKACAVYLAEARWPDGFRCPECAHGKGWGLATKALTWECASCGKQTSVTADTMMHYAHLRAAILRSGRRRPA